MAELGSALHERLTDAAAVSALVSTRVYPVIVPQDAPLPYIRYQIVADPRPEHMKGYNGTRQTRVQLDCFAPTYGAARELSKAVIDALAEAADYGGVHFGRGKAEGPRDLGEDTAKGFIHRASLDVMLEHDGD